MPGPQPVDCIPLPVRNVGRGLDPSASARGLAALQFPASICHPAGHRGRRPLQPYAKIQYYIKGLPNENCHYLPRLPEKSGGCRCFLPAENDDGESPELETARALVARQYASKLAAGKRDQVAAALARRGFSHAVIREVLSDYE